MNLARVTERFWFPSLLVLGVGCAVSNSLMSVGVFLITLLISQKFLEARPQPLPWHLRWGFAYALWLSLGVLFLIPADAWLSKFGNIVMILGWVLSTYPPRRSLSDRQLRWIEALLVVAYLVLWARCWHQHYELKLRRVNGFHQNPNYLSAAIMPALIYFGQRLLSALRDHRRWGLIYLMPIAIASHLFFMTLTRSVFPIFVLYMAYLVVMILHLSVTRRSLRLAGMVLLTSATSALAYLFTFSKFYRRLDWQKFLNDPAVLSRMEIWKINWQHFLDSPIWGVGLLNNKVAVADHPVLQQWMRVETSGFLAHNTYVQILAESGAVGIALFLLFMICAVRAVLPLRWFFVLILITGLGDTALHMDRAMPSLIFFSLLTMIVATREDMARA
ncbi:MAG TPA: O-antigen ligase family protein [Bdellovibrionota bacterium]|jgi:O-antigen ligase|nr:O-antigen ligase family protein [Bdellovibrionota bacterium]